MVDHFQVELRAKNALFEKEHLSKVLQAGCQDLIDKLILSDLSM